MDGVFHGKSIYKWMTPGVALFQETSNMEHTHGTSGTLNSEIGCFVTTSHSWASIRNQTQRSPVNWA